MGRKFGGPPLLGRGQRDPHLTQSRQGSRPSSIPSDILIHAAIWPEQIWAENWGLCPFAGGELGRHLTDVVRPRPICVPSFILIHPTVWPQNANVTDRTGQDRTGRQDRQWCDSIGRSVLQTVAQRSSRLRGCKRAIVQFIA